MNVNEVELEQTIICVNINVDHIGIDPKNTS